MIMYICVVLGPNVHKACVLHFCICIWSVQLSVHYTEKHYRNKIKCYQYDHYVSNAHNIHVYVLPL